MPPILPIPPSGTPWFDPITGQVHLLWANYLLFLQRALGTGPAPASGPFVTVTADPQLTNETNLGALASGFLQIATAGGIATLSTVSAIASADVTDVRPVINVKDHGALGDDTADDTAAFQVSRALAAAMGLSLYAPAGRYQLDYSVLAPTVGLLIADGMELYGEGRRRTFLVNRSSTAALLSVPGFCNVHDLTVDQNFGAGPAVRVYGAYTHLHDLEILNQGIGAYALNLTTPTLSTYTDLQLHNCYNGIDIGAGSGISYLTFRGVIVEPAGGVAFHAAGSTNLTFIGCYIENINAITTHPALVRFERCVDVTWIGFACELFGTLTDSAYFIYEDCQNVNHYGGKVNPSATSTASKIVYSVTGTAPYVSRNINWDGMQFYGAKNSTVLIDLAGVNAPTNINVRNIRTDLTGTGCTGVRFTTAGSLCSVENWTNQDQNAAMAFGATADLYVRNVPASSPISVTTAARQLFLNCAGTFTGTGAATATRIESAAAGLLTSGDVTAATLNTAGPDADLNMTRDGGAIFKIQPGGASSATLLRGVSNNPIGIYTNNALRLTISTAGLITLANYAAGTPTRVAGDCYLLVDGSGNLHVSAVGPLS